MDELKKDFPIFQSNPKLVYLDSTATSQKPKCVIDRLNKFYSEENANVHRGTYKLSENATVEYDAVRKKIKDFIGAREEKEIIYTKGATESTNLVMRAWGEKNVKEGDKIVTTIMEHHANFIPWQQLAKKKKAKFEVIDINDNGTLKDSELDKLKGAKFFAVTHCSNVLGTINDVKRLCQIARKEGAVTLIDGVQSIPHIPIDVKGIDCDFFVFSGHKMLAPFGSGALYAKKKLLEEMDPFLYGGDMIKSVKVEETTWNEVPLKFEAGTPIIAEMIGLGTAIDYLKKIGMKRIREHEIKLTKYAFEKLDNLVKIYGPKDTNQRGGIIPFTIDRIHAHDVSAMLSEYNVATRSGHHCAMPLHTRLNLAATSRASFYIYNTEEDVDKLAEALKKIKSMF
ncbi:MAG: SufS family cysteine desulfurase [Candidatus Micrarchaeota archaeon]